MKIDVDEEGTFTISGDVYELGFENYLQKALLDAAGTIEWMLDPSYVDVWEALMVVIPYFSTQEQIEELKDYQADQEWVNIVFNHNFNR